MDEAAALQIAPDHLAGADASLLDDVGRGDVEDAGLRGEDEEVVARERVARGAQAVAVEGGADVHAVGEAHGGGPVPGFHELRMIVEEAAHVAPEVVVGAPGLRHEHEHRMGQAAPAGREQFEHVVEAGGVALRLVDERQQLGEVLAEERAAQERFAAAELVEVAAQRVDFAVVRQEAIGMRELPGRERVRAVALVHEHERALEVGVAQIGIEGVDLGREQQPLVDDAPAGAAREVAAADRLLDEAAHDEEFALERGGVRERRAVEEELADARAAFARGAADAGRIRGHLAPGDDAESFGCGDAFEVGLGVFAAEDHGHAVAPRGGELRAQMLAEELVGDGEEQAGAVARLRIAPCRATMHETLEHRQAVGDDRVRGLVVQMGDQPDAACVVLVSETVQPLVLREVQQGPLPGSGVLHVHSPESVHFQWVGSRRS